MAGSKDFLQAGLIVMNRFVVATKKSWLRCGSGALNPSEVLLILGLKLR